MRGRRRLLAAVAVLVAGGCSLPTDRAPEAIGPEDVPFGLLGEGDDAPEAEPGPGTRTVSLYFVGPNETLREVTRVLETTGDRAVIASLLAGKTETDPEILASSIPSGVELLAVDREGDDHEVLVLDLSAEISSIVNPGLQQAVAQLTFTGLELPGVAAVRFAIEGEPFLIGANDGRPDIIDAVDFPDLLVIDLGGGGGEVDTPTDG